MKLELYILPGCPFCKKVTRFIEKSGLEDRVEIKSIEDFENQKRVIEDGGKDQYPCLFVDGKPMYESSEIVKFLKTI